MIINTVTDSLAIKKSMEQHIPGEMSQTIFLWIENANITNMESNFFQKAKLK